MQRIAFFLVWLPTFFLAGCYALPLPVPIGSQVGREEIGTLRPGLSTREDVHAMLGAPSHSVTQQYDIFEVSKEESSWIEMVLITPGYVMRSGAEDYRVLTEYGPDGVLQSLAWEGRLGDHPSSYRYLSSRSQRAKSDPESGGVGMPVRPGSAHRSWAAPSVAGAVTASPDEPIVALAYRADPGDIRTTLRNWHTGAAVAEVFGTPAGCPELLSPDRSPAGLVPMAFLDDGQHLVSGAEEARVCVWDWKTRQRVLVFEKHWQPRALFGLEPGNRLASIDSARLASTVATADDDNTVRAWDGLTGRELVSIGACASGPGCGSWVVTSLGRVTLSDDGRILAFFQGGRQEDAVRLWDTATATELATFSLPEKTRARWAHLVTTALSPDERRLALHMGDHIQVWRSADALPSLSAGVSQPPRRSFDLEKVFITPPVTVDIMPGTASESQQYVRSLQFSADGRRLAAGGDELVIVWETEGWQEVGRTRIHRHEPFAFVDNGQRIVTGSRVLPLPGSTEAGSPPPGELTSPS